MRRRRRRQKRSSGILIILACCTICFLCGFSFRGNMTTAYADNSQDMAEYTAAASAVDTVDTIETVEPETSATSQEKMFTSICVQRGDTLYSIAQEYYTPQWGSLNDYIQEIMSTNGLTHDYIAQGNYLVIPYYN